MRSLNGARGPGKPRKPRMETFRSVVLFHPLREYHGKRTANGVEVWVEVSNLSAAPVLLPPRHDLWDHSPDGFEWGYGGSGPAQLALAILANALRDDDLAVALHQQFKASVIAALPKDRWSLSLEVVRAWAEGAVEEREEENRAAEADTEEEPQS